MDKNKINFIQRYSKEENYKGNLITAGAVFIMLIAVIFGFIENHGSFTYKNTQPYVNTTTSDESATNTPVNTAPISDDDRIVNIIKQKISNRVFTNNANGFITSIKFEPSVDDAPFGSAIMTQLNGHIVYTYQIDGNNIKIKYYGSDCGRTANDQTLFYDGVNDCVYTFVDAQRFEFK